MRKPLLIGSLAVVMLATGCANMTDTQRTHAGAMTGGHAAQGAVIGAGVGALGTYIWSQHMERQKQDMQAATQGTGVTVTQTPDNQLKLDIPSDISFATNRSDIQPNFRPILDRFAEGLRNNPNTEVRIVGHTDSTGSDAINNPLSLDRAESTRNYLTARGVNGNRIHVEGRGSREPVASNDTSDARARNRRVAIYLGERQGRG